ncbi:hypothetical protein C1645_838440 [Glomus cerebriforme]|uniref:Uncharacterized protein n=1 Tax=Glomus cerebriforme TaxID=658196 RepID=A0A397S525_9GLOM|nr:hypothetical protein C1645_838440 [Glomus cerebriforme]
MDGYYNLLKGFRKSYDELVKLKGEKDLEISEKDLFSESELELVQEQEIYEETEIVEVGMVNLESDLIHQPTFNYQKPKKALLDPNTNQPLFYVEIELNNCYFTDANALTSFLWFHDQVKKLSIEKVEDAQELLQALKLKIMELGNAGGVDLTNASLMNSMAQEQIFKGAIECCRIVDLIDLEDPNKSLLFQQAQTSKFMFQGKLCFRCLVKLNGILVSWNENIVKIN